MTSLNEPREVLPCRKEGEDGWMDEECDEVADFGSGKKGVTN